MIKTEEQSPKNGLVDIIQEKVEEKRNSVFLKVERALGIMFFIVAILIPTVLGYWQFFDTDVPVEIVDQYPFPHDGTGYSKETLVRKDKFYPGDTIYTWMELCYYKSVKGRVYISLIDGLYYNYGDHPINTYRTGCFKRTYARVVPNLPPGHYLYNVRLEYDVNPIKKLILKRKEIPFQILKRQEENYE